MKNKIIIIVGVLVLSVVCFYAVNSYIYNEKQGDVNAIPEPSQMTLTGVQVCLPHKNTEGPQTLECALGMLADNGFYYALDYNLMSITPPDFSTGERFTVTGIFTPIERLSSGFWQKYNVVGVLSVTDSVQKI